jgi:hypothetical protein
MLEWEERIGLSKAADLVGHPQLCDGPPLPTDQRAVDLFLGRAKLTGRWSGSDVLLADHGEALQRAQQLWSNPEFLSSVSALLRDEVKFPPVVAEMLAPLMFCEYVEWADAGPAVRLQYDEPTKEQLARGLVQQMDMETGTYLGPVRGTVRGGSLPPCAYFATCPLQPPSAGAAFGRLVADTLELKRRGPRKDSSYLVERARWYFEVEVLTRQFGPVAPFTVTDVASGIHPASSHAHLEYSPASCGCYQKVADGVAEVKRLLGLPN